MQWPRKNKDKTEIAKSLLYDNVAKKGIKIKQRMQSHTIWKYESLYGNNEKLNEKCEVKIPIEELLYFRANNLKWGYNL